MQFDSSFPIDYFKADVCFASFSGAEAVDVAVGAPILSAEELATWHRLEGSAIASQYLVSRALVRHALSQHAAVDPKDWQFVRNRWGRPEVTSPATKPPLSFSISHTGNLVAVAIGVGIEVGLDVEDTMRNVEYRVLVDRCLTVRERDRIISSPNASEGRSCFFRFWTLKEAYLKGVGVGLTVPTREIEFDLGAGDGPTLRKTVPHLSLGWHFFEWKLGCRYQFSLALKNDLGMASQTKLKWLSFSLGQCGLC